MKRFLILLLAAGLAPGLFADLTLAKNGKANYVISGEIKSEPAKELQYFLQKMSGAKFALVPEKAVKKGQKAIYVGHSAFARKNGLDFAGFKPEAWEWKVIGNNLVIGGHAHFGNILAVSNLLEREFGCYILTWDGADLIPAKKTLILKKKGAKGTPSFTSRQIADGFYMSPGAITRKCRKMHRRYLNYNGGNLDVTIHNARSKYFINCHNLYYLLPPKKYFKAHPEYYSMDEAGKRFHGDARTRCGGNICFTNKDVARISAENLKEIILKNQKLFPKYHAPIVYLIQQLDASRFLCLCPECEKLSKEENSSGAPMFLYVNRIAKLLKKDFPNIRLMCGPYGDKRKTPKTMKLDPAVMLQWGPRFTQRDTYRPFTHPVNKKMYDTYMMWDKWHNVDAMWDYWNMGMGKYFAVPRLDTAIDGLTHDLKFFYKNGLRWMFIENEGTFYFNRPAFQELENFVGMQLLKDIHQDPEKLITLFMDGYYGPAAGEMKEYLSMLRKGMAKEKAPMVALNNVFRSYQTGPFLRKVYDLIHKGLKKVPANSIYAIRLRRDLITPIAAILYNSRLKTGLDQKKLIAEYRKYRTEMLDRYCRPDRKTAMLKVLEKDIKKYTSPLIIPTPAQFKHIPEDRILKFGYDRLTYRDNNKYVKDDPDSTIGKSLCTPPETATLYHGWGSKGSTHARMWSTTFLINNWNMSYNTSRVLWAKDVKDEKFHWYKLGTFEFKPGRVDILFWWWLCQLSLSDVYIPPDGTNDINIYEVWISVKITGPKYFPGSKKPNGIYMDQAILIRKEMKK